ncbi:hypothetical protein LINPERPRIM_LOCUS1029 [Linum perenne]
MVWMVEKLKHTNNSMARSRIGSVRLWLAAFLCWICLMLVTPTIPLSNKHHLFADKRNFVGIPNTLNVITNFPFLVVGVVGFVLSLRGFLLNISLPGELFGWVFFYGGMVAVAFGSAYYHLKPEDGRVMWDTLPMIIAYSSLFSSFMVERLGKRVGLSCSFGLLGLVMLTSAYTRTFNDLRLCMMFQLIPCVAIPCMNTMLPTKYTHSTYWFCASGAYLLSKLQGSLDHKIYHTNCYFISGHSLEHLCLAAAPVLLTAMLIRRNVKFQRLVGDEEILGNAARVRKS